MKHLPEHGSCFVCGKENDQSIGIRWFLREDHAIWGTITLTEKQQGPPNLAHGGATAALLDEAMGAAVWNEGFVAAAVNINIDYLKPVRLGVKIEITGRFVERKGKSIHAYGEIVLPDGGIAVVSKGIYVEAPQLFEEQLNQYKKFKS